jgi:5'-3' exonuclease
MADIFQISTMNPTFIFVDGSYYCFYRYYALMNWWRNAYPEEKLEDPFQNTIFVDKFKKTFVENMEQLPKKLGITKTTNPIVVVGKDCKRETIWRNEIFPAYKGTRNQDDGFMGGPFFKMAYEENLFIEGGAQYIISNPKLEADDCIALSVMYLVKKYPQCHIYIITSDRDYLQLNAHNVDLYNLAFKNIAENKSSTGNAKHDLEIKIIMGDTSDNIPSVFPKCGPKTALKCIEDKEFFKKKMALCETSHIQYQLNKKLVDFNEIPYELKHNFYTNVLKITETFWNS